MKSSLKPLQADTLFREVAMKTVASEHIRRGGRFTMAEPCLFVCLRCAPMLCRATHVHVVCKFLSLAWASAFVHLAIWSSISHRLAAFIMSLSHARDSFEPNWIPNVLTRPSLPARVRCSRKFSHEFVEVMGGLARVESTPELHFPSFKQILKRFVVKINQKLWIN